MENFIESKNVIQNTEFNDELDFKKILNLFFRNKRFIILFTFILTFISILITKSIKPIYSGNFQIIVKDESNEGNKLDFNINNIVTNNFKSDTNKTQEYILKSPSVLRPVFNFAKKEYIERGENVSSLKYKQWLKKNLSIAFKNQTKVLDIEFKDKNQEFIIKTLNLIRERYEIYSKKNKEKTLQKKVNFLSSQREILRDKNNTSLKNLNEFSIENGLGDVDGFIMFEKEQYKNLNGRLSFNEGEDFKFSPQQIQTPEPQNRPRFQKQFLLLEEYEALYVDLSSKLKPQSSTLKELKIKIDNLRSSLKRPNEILVKFRELNLISIRNETLLGNIEKELSMAKISLANQSDPWQLISKPEIDGKLFPKVSRIAILSLLISTWTSYLIAFIREKRSGIIYEVEEINSLVNVPLLDILLSKEYNINIELIKSFISRDLKGEKQPSKNFKTALVFGNIENSNQYKVNDFIKLQKEDNIISTNIGDSKTIKSSQKLIFLIMNGKVTKKDIQLINQFINIYPQNSIGWFCLKTMN